MPCSQFRTDAAAEEFAYALFGYGDEDWLMETIPYTLVRLRERGLLANEGDEWWGLPIPEGESIDPSDSRPQNGRRRK